MKKIYLIIVLLVLIPLNVKATSLEFDCPEKATPNSNIECNLKTSDQLKGLKLNISLPQEITTNKIDNTWNSHYNGNKGIVVTNNNSGSNISKIFFDISNQAIIGKEYQINLINIEASDNEHKLVQIENITKKVKIVSNDNTLSNINITGGSLSPIFNKNTTSYAATVNSDKTTITATPTHNGSKVEGNIGEVKLNYGINNIVINVTSEMGTTKVYKIDITRPFPTQNQTSNNTTTNKNNTITNNKKNSSSNSSKKQDNNKIVINKRSDASLKEIIIKDYEIDFSPNTFQYELTVPNDVTNIEVTATPNNDKATVDISNPDILEVGDNRVYITITAEDGTIAKYEIIVTREEEQKEDNQETTTNVEKITSNKKISIFPSVPLSIVIIIILLILLILFIILKRIFKKDN